MDDAVHLGVQKEGEHRDPATVKEAYDAWHKCISGILLPILDNPNKVNDTGWHDVMTTLVVAFPYNWEYEK